MEKRVLDGAFQDEGLFLVWLVCAHAVGACDDGYDRPV